MSKVKGYMKLKDVESLCYWCYGNKDCIHFQKWIGLALFRSNQHNGFLCVRNCENYYPDDQIDCNYVGHKIDLEKRRIVKK